MKDTLPMTTDRLAARFADLQAQRARDWPPEQLAANAAIRAQLVERYNPRQHVQLGEEVEDFTLIGIAGEEIRRDTLLANGPAVLMFYRYGGCPACNIALPYYDRHLSAALTAAGIPLVAVSPQVPADAALLSRHGLSLTIASDPDHRLGEWLGITFEPDEKPEIKPGESWIGAVAGTNSWALPQPTVLILDSDASVRFVAVSPDWLDRPEADVILAALPECDRAARAA